MNPLSIALVAIGMVISSSVSAANLDDLKIDYMKLLTECSREYTVTPEDIAMLQKNQMPDKGTVKCLFACSLKKTKLMDDSGMLSVNGLNSMIEKYFGDDPLKMEKAMKFTEACKNVNDEAVSDGDKGCERAALIYKCSVENEVDFLV